MKRDFNFSINHFAPLGYSLALAGVPFVSSCTTEEKGVLDMEQPNIMLIIAEDMTLDLGCYGRTDVRTPNIDRLAAEGVMFTNARSCAPISSPTRAAMMTGLHQEITQSHNHRSHRDKPLPEPYHPFTVELREAGYTCILGNDCCFENEFTKKDSESSRKIDCNFKFENTGPYDGVNSFGLFDRLYNVQPEDMPFFNQVTLYVTHRGDWWKSIREQSANPVDPQSVVLPPYMADHPIIREEFATYLDQVEYMDNEVGMLMNELKEKRLDENTIVIFIADNGRADVRAKGYLYDEGTHIPMIVWGKGIKPGVVDDLVSQLDITASILHLAGVEIPKHYQGKVLDLFRKAEDTTTPQHQGHEYVYTARDTWDEVIECIRAVTTDRYIYIRNYLPEVPYDAHHHYMDFYRPALHIMRKMNSEGTLNDAQRLYFAPTKPAEELYDYTLDPFCLTNIAEREDMQAVKAELSAKMDQWQSANTDHGVLDRYTRVLADDRKEENRQRYYLMHHKPEEWKKITEGAICDKYDIWKTELLELKNRNRAK